MLAVDGGPTVDGPDAEEFFGMGGVTEAWVGCAALRVGVGVIGTEAAAGEGEDDAR